MRGKIATNAFMKCNRHTCILGDKLEHYNTNF